MFRLSRLTGRKIDRLNKKLRDVNLYLHRFFLVFVTALLISV